MLFVRESTQSPQELLCVVFVLGSTVVLLQEPSFSFLLLLLLLLLQHAAVKVVWCSCDFQQQYSLYVVLVITYCVTHSVAASVG